MKQKLQRVFEGSGIINFFANLNANLLVCFYNSRTYAVFAGMSRFLKDPVGKNAGGSVVLNFARNIAKNTKMWDMGLFIVLVTVFNTLAMIFLRREIDIFSICARVAFFVLGVALFTRKRNAK